MQQRADKVERQPTDGREYMSMGHLKIKQKVQTLSAKKELTNYIIKRKMIGIDTP